MIESAYDIRYLERPLIDTGQWDRCILHSANGLIYARSFYLDAMSVKWSALVLNDYEAVMPLTWKKKYGVSYLYQPAFTAQLGIFSQHSVTENIVGNYIGLAKQHFQFCEIHLNFANPVADNVARTNYILDLGKPYEEIRSGYKKRLLENLREADTHHLTYLPSGDYSGIIRMFKNLYGKRFPRVREADYHQFEYLCSELNRRNMIFARQVKDSSGEVMNASIFFLDDHRIYNIMSVSLPAGREKRAHFYLLDQLIREFESKKLLLDFEGSEVPGIAEFYRKFGTVNQPYSFLKYNNLPFPLRYFK